MFSTSLFYEVNGSSSPKTMAATTAKDMIFLNLLEYNIMHSPFCNCHKIYDIPF
jgi:hypothetical protein